MDLLELKRLKPAIGEILTERNGCVFRRDQVPARSGLAPAVCPKSPLYNQ